jgi:phospholipid/cholesterol/gamma-HCH transport system substrate-binding protein
MAQRNQLTWTELRVGIFVLIGIGVVVLGIFYVTGSGAWGAKYRLNTYLPEVSGLTIGAPVTLNGVEVGNVDTIRVAPQKPGETPNPNRSVQVVMRINRDFQPDIRSDSVITLYTEGFLGNRVVSVQRGYTGKVLQDGDEVSGSAEKDMKAVVQSGADLMQNLNALSVQLASVVDRVQRGEGTLGKLLVDQTAYNHLDNSLAHVEQLVAAIQRGQGTVGKLVTSDELYNKVNSVTGRADDVLTAVQQQKGSLGKLVYDPTLHDRVTELLSNGNGLVADVRAGRGTLGKLATDETLYTTLREAGQNVKDATAKLNSNQGTAGKVFTDPQFYDNMTALAGDLRLLAGEFRQNPKKFLRVKFSIF